MSLRGDSKSPGMPLKASSKTAGPTPTKRRNSTLWSETLDVHQKSTFSTKEIKRQEVVHFFLLRVWESPDRTGMVTSLVGLCFCFRQSMSFTGESKISLKISSLHERFEHVVFFPWYSTKYEYLFSRYHCCFLNFKAYHDPMLKLSIMTKEELAHIFGDLDAYIPLHEGILPFGPNVCSLMCLTKCF